MGPNNALSRNRIGAPSKEGAQPRRLMTSARLCLALLMFFLSAHSFSVSQLRLGWSPDSAMTIDQRLPLHRPVGNPFKLSAFTAERVASETGVILVSVPNPVDGPTRLLVDVDMDRAVSGSSPPCRSLTLTLRI